MHDICVIGAGWAGFNAAIRAKELGANKVTLIEKDNIGGTCLNRGCIPTKVLVNSAKIFSDIKKSNEFGINHKGASLSFTDVLKRKNNIISTLRNGMQFILKQHSIEYINAEAKLVSDRKLLINGKTINTDYIIIAAGSSPIELPFLKFNNQNIISSDGILELDSIPETLLIVGGGVIGCEFASVFSQFGARVTVIELMDKILPQEDADISLKLTALFKRKGIEVITKQSVQSLDMAKFKKVLVCVGRKPNIQNLNLEGFGIVVEKNRIKTDEFLRTNIKNIYAIGDCIARIMLAHTASMEGRIACENIFLKPRQPVYNAVPNCIFTKPLIASCGITEQKAKELNLDVSVNKFDFKAVGMAHILGETDGFVKIISDKINGQVLGAAIIGEEATELISALAIAIQNKLTTADIQKTIFAHPTLSEAIWETANISNRSNAQDKP